MAKFQVEYRNYLTDEAWKVLSQKYDTFNRAATVAQALENRGHKTRIVECKGA